MPPDVWITLGVALLGSGALTAVLTPMANRRAARVAEAAAEKKARIEAEKSRVDGAQVLTDAAVKLLQPLKEQIDEAARRAVEANRRIEHLSRSLGESQEQVMRLTRYVELLVAVIREAGLPVPHPEEAEG